MADEQARYRFWAELTAAQARNTGYPIRRVNRRVRKAFQAICQLIDPTVTVELGAHEASFSRWAAKTFPDARCVALEANPHVYARFRDRLVRARVDYRHLAAADSNGLVTLHIPRKFRAEKGPDNKMGSLALHRHDRAHDSVEVAGVRVDDLIELGEDDRVVVWIDVEGASRPVLEGARDVLARATAVYIEVESEEIWPGEWLDTDVNAFFASIGKIPAMRDLQRKHQYNVLYLDQELCLRREVVESLAAVMRPASDGAHAERGWQRLFRRNG